MLSAGFLRRIPAGILLLLVFSSFVWADTAQIQFSTTTGAGNTVSATMVLSWDGSKLTVSITNTSSDNSVITGFGLVGAGVGGLTTFQAMGTQNDAAWFLGQNLSLSPPGQFGTFAFGGDTGPAGLNAGTPGAGILAGTTAVFMFSGLNTSATSVFDFLNVGAANSNGLIAALRFQTVGPNGNDSAKVGATPTQATQVPEPGVMGLLAAGLSGLFVAGGYFRFRR